MKIDVETIRRINKALLPHYLKLRPVNGSKNGSQRKRLGEWVIRSRRNGRIAKRQVDPTALAIELGVHTTPMDSTVALLAWAHLLSDHPEECWRQNFARIPPELIAKIPPDDLTAMCALPIEQRGARLDKLLAHHASVEAA